MVPEERKADSSEGTRAEVEEPDQPTELGVAWGTGESPPAASSSGVDGSAGQQHCGRAGTRCYTASGADCAEADVVCDVAGQHTLRDAHGEDSDSSTAAA